MSLIYLILGLFGFVVQTKVLAEVVSKKLFNKIGKWLLNLRELFFYVCVSMWIAYVFTSVLAFYYGMLAGLGFAGMVLLYSVMFELAKYLRERDLARRRKKK